MVSKYILMAIVFSGLVTWIPRMIPFILAKYKGLPPIVERFLKFLPVSDYAKTDSLTQSLHHSGSCCCFLFCTLDSGVSVPSCPVCDLARLYHGGDFGWSVSIF